MPGGEVYCDRDHAVIALILSGAFLFCLLIALAVYLMRRVDSDEDWQVSNERLAQLRRMRANGGR